MSEMNVLNMDLGCTMKSGLLKSFILTLILKSLTSLFGSEGKITTKMIPMIVGKNIKQFIIGVILAAILNSCSEITIIDGFRVKAVNIEVNNFEVGVSSEGTKKIDVNDDGQHDIGLGLGFFRSDTMLENYYFGIEPLETNIYIASSEFLDTLYECKPTQGSGSSKTTTFNSLSPFVCDDSMFLEQVETNAELYPTIFDSNDIDYGSVIWSNDKLTMSRCEKRSSVISGTVSIVHDFWVNQKEKYLFFELRDKIHQKGYLKLDSDESGSYRIYEIGLEDL